MITEVTDRRHFNAAGLKSGVIHVAALLILGMLLAGQAMAYDFADAVRDLDPEGKGRDVSIRYIHFLQRFVSLADKDENARAVFHLIREAFMNFDLSRLYKSDYFTQWENGFYGISVLGDICPERIDLAAIPHEQMGDACLDGKGFGSFTGEFAIRKNLNPPAGRLSDTITANGTWLSGDISWVHITRLLDNLMMVIDPDNLDLLRRQRGIKPGASFDVTDVFRETFPRLFVDMKVLELSSSAVVKTADGCRYTDFTLNVGSDPDGIEARFPLVAKFMEKMNKHGYAELVLKDKQGRTLLELFLGAQRDFFRLRVRTRGGMVIPVDTAADAPFPAEAFAVHQLANYAWEPRLNMTGRALGLKIAISDQIISGEYATDGSTMRLAHKMINKPEVEISGAVLGIIPISVIDLVIPETVNGLANDFNTVMFQANRGQGTLFEAQWDMREPQSGRLCWKAQTELPDNDFIRIGMKFFARMFLMDEKTFDEFRHLISAGMEAFAQDLQSMEV
ncbi:MAG: hypothetical protein AB1724_15825 [Thermodesulfobacteriota bacterium]